MKRALLLIFIFLQVYICSAQQVFSLDDDQKCIDSLKVVVDNSRSDSIKAIVNLKLSNLYRRNKQLDLSIKHLNTAKAHIKQNPFLKDYLLYFDALKLLNVADYHGFDKALVASNEKLKKYKFKEAYRIRATILSNHATMQQVFNNEQKAIKIIIDKAIPTALKSEDNELVGNLYKSLGIIFMNYPERQKANEYLSDALIYFKKADKSSTTYKESFIETLVVYSENLIELQNYELANIYLKTANDILKDYPISNLNSIYYYSKGLYFHKNKQYRQAIANYNKGIENTVLHNGIFTKFRLQFAMHQTFMALKDYTSSKRILSELLATNIYLKEDQKNYMKDLAIVYEKLGDINKSNQFYKSYIKLNDSLNEASHKQEILEQESRFNKTVNENKIKQLQSQKVRTELEAKNDKLQFAVIFLFAGVLVVILVLVLFYLRNKNRFEIEKNLINQQKIHLLKNQKEVEVMQAMIDGEELERKRIARELHDGIGSKLSALKIMLNRLQPSTNSKEIIPINELLSTSINELRQVSYNLVPESLAKLGLKNALSDLCFLLHSNTIKIEFQTFGIQENIPVSIQINIYRIVQELVNNALKHANCTEILVSCSQNEDTFLISVEDNGKGFDIENQNTKTGLGLKNLNSRIKMLNGLFNLESSSAGTCYNIELKVAK